MLGREKVGKEKERSQDKGKGWKARLGRKGLIKLACILFIGLLCALVPS